MIYEDSLVSRALNIIIGSLVFFVFVAGLTYYLQSSLILVKQYDAYTHWAVVLLGLPVLAGLIQRLLRITYPMFTTLVGAIGAATVLYPQYQKFWAVPPTTMDMFIYLVIIVGIGFIASQPLKTTFMMAFRRGKFSMPGFSTGGSKAKPVRKADMSKTQRMQVQGGRSDMVAMIELLVGFASLALSLFSIFFLSQG
ncbi:MAG: hypothetical protein OEX12_09940 [Gammaproteobacteria bacterium]|nr:hypothetical protein [Gammaproteobacteria bacterium]